MTEKLPGLEHSFTVYQAQGMVTVQAACTFAEAFTLMNERAQVQHLTVEEVAEAVVERRIRFG
ncbi:MAG TPA: ANTAR domain-containing protein [Acidimicrobiia bacterium]|nr:ANTAR domain-containing protein [Acidimicrobiia bacterium]